MQIYDKGLCLPSEEDSMAFFKALGKARLANMIDANCFLYSLVYHLQDDGRLDAIESGFDLKLAKLFDEVKDANQ